MNTGEKNIKGRVIYKGPRGGHYILRNGKKVYAFKRVGNQLNNLNRRMQAVNLAPHEALNNVAVLQPGNFGYVPPPRIVIDNSYYQRSWPQNNLVASNGTRANKNVYIIALILLEFGAKRPAHVMMQLDLLHNTLIAGSIFGSNQSYQNKITSEIAMCHLVDSMRDMNLQSRFTFRKFYLKRMRNQMVQACNNILDKIKKRKMTKENFVREFESLYADRPCLENLIQALSDVAYGEVGWKGKNASKLLIIGQNNRTTNNSRKILRNNVLGTYIKPLFNGMTKLQQIKFNKQIFWNAVKNKNVYVMNPNIHEQPGYAKLSVIMNARNVSNEAFNEHGQYLPFPDKYNVLVNAIKKYKQVRRR
jgi:hypothetical protein